MIRIQLRSFRKQPRRCILIEQHRHQWQIHRHRQCARCETAFEHHHRHTHRIKPGGATTGDDMIRTCDAKLDADRRCRLAVNGVAGSHQTKRPAPGPWPKPTRRIAATRADHQCGISQIAFTPGRLGDRLTRRMQSRHGRGAPFAASQRFAIRNPCSGRSRVRAVISQQISKRPKWHDSVRDRIKMRRQINTERRQSTQSLDGK